MPLPQDTPLSPAPIAQVAGDASARAALADLAEAVETVRAEGRMIELLDLASIEAGYLVRDRLEQDEDEMGALMASLRARGQQTPIEVIRLPEPTGGHSYGLISGWRRLTALRRLYEEEKDPRFATVRALVIAPETAQDAYVAMVEENEIRVNLSHYERARIALRAVHEGVYPTPRTALQGLYAATTRSKRSKIGTFITVVEALDPVLKYPTAISEKLGLALAGELTRNPGLAAILRARLQTEPQATATEELQLLAAALKAPAPVKTPVSETDSAARGLGDEPVLKTAPSRVRVTQGVVLMFDAEANRIELTGPHADARLCAALKEWLVGRET